MLQAIRKFNPFAPNVLFLYPLKTSENLTVVSKERVKWCSGNEWVNDDFAKNKAELATKRVKNFVTKRIKN